MSKGEHASPLALNREGVSPGDAYRASLAEGAVLEDEAQAQVMALLDQRFTQLVARSANKAGWFASLANKFLSSKSGRADTSIKGLYLWGGVGRGKTMMMDMFCHALPPERRQRMHFHRFMRRVHDGLGRFSGQANPLLKVADEIASQGDVLCFDEFFVSDIGDAMILGEVMTALFARGVVLVATSNVEPANLYKNGLQRSRFLPAIDQIYAHCDVHEIDQGQDFRLRTLQQARLYHWPLSESTDQSMRESFSALASDREKSNVRLRVENRMIEALKVAGDVAWFRFSSLCEGPRSQNDYIELATLFTTVLISEVPVLDVNREDAARRFISLVDEFYDRRVKLVISADQPITDLYQGQRLSFEFERTQSRLLEMQSEEYLSQPHVALGVPIP
ncbi:cell division protein ZapE [Pseudomonadales bacterium]|jgi:cell division protein ZapE|nr:cell division protein ZapE [Pseudomonadales bacterium]